MDQLGFIALLIVAIVLSFAFSYQQHRAYVGAIRDLADTHDRNGVVIVSGRGKGFLRGCVVILAVDSTTRRILEARTMQGSTVLARFHRAGFLEGGLRGVLERATSKHMVTALEQATTQFRETAKPTRSLRARAARTVTPEGTPA
ncbi:transcriptional regulator [Brachybacterium ginsengisoli]|uniref:Transcriptional regulator n=1 Tax=Brachybacterium ginsengisoli TaxID=1331682 RepID=A0A291H0J2_9MICO|nr:transcriptional regulator GutM [Brachybacterium ginsengisoli]ATG55989.1 transcriptional regulator [Brachybacterium ginsengisoli]